jgi:hypothetical protein
MSFELDYLVISINSVAFVRKSTADSKLALVQALSAD